MIENDVHAIIVEAMHKRHQEFAMNKLNCEYRKWSDLPEIVKDEIDAQATAIVKALDGYLD